MNALIAQFAEQAKNSVPAGLDTVAWIAKYNEIFAELIVRECMALCKSMDETDIQYRYDYRRGVLDCVDTIKEHFGVEE